MTAIVHLYLKLILIVAALVVMISACTPSTQKYTAVKAEFGNLRATLNEMQTFGDRAGTNRAVTNILDYRDLFLADKNGAKLRSTQNTNQPICIHTNAVVWSAFVKEPSSNGVRLVIAPKYANLTAVVSPIPFRLDGFEGTNYLAFTFGEVPVVLKEIPTWARGQVRADSTNVVTGAMW